MLKKPRNARTTQAITSMQEAVQDAIYKTTESLLDLKKYQLFSCDTCIHSNKKVTSYPCNICTSATKEDERDYKIEDRNYWTPNKSASVEEIKAFYKKYALRSMEHFEEHPPARCINPKCSHEHPKVYKRGLCKFCFTELKKRVTKDAKEAKNILLVTATSDSKFMYEACIAAYYKLNTWQKYVVLGWALPEETDFDGQLLNMGMQHYYEIACKNNGTVKRDKLLKKGLSKEDIATLSLYVIIEED